ncbi:MAG: dienelactone hydrolase family protein [Oceanibaculum sp.]
MTKGEPMKQWIELTAADGHKFDAYTAGPNGKPKGGLVVIQEIFGVNAHIRSVCDGFAADGYLCVSPALFDRTERKVELGYDQAGIASGRELRAKVTWEQVMLDMAASVEAASAAGKIGTVGYCWGGSISFLCATRLPVQGSVVYYGGQIVPFKDEAARAPLLMHFGEADKGIPLSDVDQIRKAQPQAAIHIYPADHGFNCDARGSYEPTSARIARERTLDFFRQHIG